MKFSRLLLLACFTVFFVSGTALAQGCGTEDPFCLGAAAPEGLAKQPIEVVVANMVSVVLGLVGTMFIVLIIYAGFKWMNSGGNERAIDEAKTLIRNAVIGLIVIVSAYSITFYLASYILGATGGETPLDEAAPFIDTPPDPDDGPPVT